MQEARSLQQGSKGTDQQQSELIVGGVVVRSSILGPRGVGILWGAVSG